MGFFENIKNAIFGGPAPTETPATETQTSGFGKPVQAATASPAPAANRPAAAAAGAAGAQAASAAATEVDVAAILDAKVAAAGQKLDWRKSIVDLMKALGIDSSLSARKELAQELGYSGDMSDSASMNIWLHKQVIQKLRDSGGNVPADLLD